MNTHTHIIRRQFLEIEAPDQESANRLQEDLLQWLATNAARQIDAFLEQMGLSDRMVQINQLNLELQVNPDETWVHELEDYLLSALKRRLTSVSSGENAAPSIGKTKIARTDKSLWESWRHFLYLGYLPWWSDTMEWSDLQRQLLQNMGNRPEKLRALKYWIASDQRTLQRLCAQFPQTFLQQLDQSLQRIAEADAAARAHALSDYLRKAGLASRMPSLYWKVRISTCLFASPDAFPLVQTELFHWLLREQNLLPRSIRWWKQAPAGTRKLVFRHVFQPFAQFLKELEPVKLELVKGARKDQWETQLMIWTQEQGAAPWRSLKSSADDNSIFHSSEMAPEKEPPKERGEQEQIQDPLDLSDEQADLPFMGDTDNGPPAEVRYAENQEVDEDTGSLSDHRAESTTPRKMLKPTADPADMISEGASEMFRKELEEGIFINNAGLILTHPFLTHFFSALELISEENFISSVHQQRAVCLCQHLVTGQETFAEYELLLPKILCGWPAEETLDSSISITPRERKESIELLLSLIEHWGVLKNTDEAGLRESFLQREGKVSRSQGGLSIKVAQETQDILLTRLPWGLNMIRLPWLPEMLGTEWV